MAILEKDVEHVAHLARLALSSEEKHKFTQQLNQILTYAENLKKINTENIIPTSHAIPMETLFRADEPRLWPDKEALLGIAPGRDGNFFSVPKI